MLSTITGVTVASAQAELKPNAVCKIAKFREFIVAYSELSIDQQMSCVKIPFKLESGDGQNEKNFNSRSELMRSDISKHKIIITKKDMARNKELKACRDWWNAYESAQAREIGYNLTEDHGVELTSGGTELFSIVQFEREGDYWVASEMREYD